jgi:hypothetical protein
MANTNAPTPAIPAKIAEPKIKESISSNIAAKSVPEVPAPVRLMRKGTSRLMANWYQFCILTSRYLELMFRDRKSLRLLMFQAPAVGLLLLAGFANKQYQVDLPRLRDLTDSETANTFGAG